MVIPFEIGDFSDNINQEANTSFNMSC